MSAETDDATNKNEIRAVAEEISSRDVEDEPAAAVADAAAAVEDVVVAREEEGEEDDDEEAEGMEVDDDTAKMGKRPLETEDQPTPSASAATGDDIAPVTKTANLPDRPIKKARTAYFIFADEMRPELQKKHPGEPIGIIARETGQLWAKLDETAKALYHGKSAEERDRVSQELAKYLLDGVDFGLPPTPSARDLNTLVFPLAKLRKITKLDPEVKGLSKEALLLITKCAEMVTTKLGQETVKVAQLQNRRKLLPEDVAQVCATREQFLFLREDVKDLMKEQHLLNKKAALEKKKGEVATTVSAKPIMDFFASK